MPLPVARVFLKTPIFIPQKNIKILRMFKLWIINSFANFARNRVKCHHTEPPRVKENTGWTFSDTLLQPEEILPLWFRGKILSACDDTPARVSQFRGYLVPIRKIQRDASWRVRAIRRSFLSPVVVGGAAGYFKTRSLKKRARDGAVSVTDCMVPSPVRWEPGSRVQIPPLKSSVKSTK